MSVPQVVESYDTGVYMWVCDKGYACSFDGAFTVDPKGPLLVTPWMPSIEAARMALEIAAPYGVIVEFNFKTDWFEWLGRSHS